PHGDPQRTCTDGAHHTRSGSRGSGTHGCAARPASTASWTACATRRPQVERTPANGTWAPVPADAPAAPRSPAAAPRSPAAARLRAAVARPASGLGHITTTASLAVPVPGTPARTSTCALASVRVPTACTRAEGVRGTGTLTTTLT